MQVSFIDKFNLGLDEDDRKNPMNLLFYKAFEVIFVFTLFHEAGHLFFKHSENPIGNKTNSLLIFDKEKKEILAKEGALLSQSKEAAADLFGFKHTYYYMINSDYIVHSPLIETP